MVPLLAPVLGIDPSAGYEQAATEGRKLEEQVTEAVLDYVVACAEDQPAIVVAENLHWFDDATRGTAGRPGADRARAGCSSLGTSRNPEAGLWEAIELRPLTPTGRLALIDALGDGLTEQDRRALAARSGGIPLYLEELVRAGERRRPRRVAARRCPARSPRRSTSRSSRASTPRRRRCRSRRPRPRRASRSTARCWPPRCRSRPTSSTRRWPTLVEGQILEPVGGRGATASATSCCARSPTSCSRPRGAARSTTGSCDLLASDDPARLARARLALRARRAPPRGGRGLPADGGVGAPARRAGRGPGPPHAGDRPRRPARRATPRATIARWSCACAAGSSRWRPRARPARRPPRTSTAASSWPRPTRDGDDMFSTLISLWAALPLARRARPRPRGHRPRCAASLERQARRLPPAEPRGAFGMLDWFAGNFAGAVDGLSASTTTGPGRAWTRSSPPLWFVPNDPTVGDARAPRAGPVHGRRRGRGAGEPGAGPTRSRRRSTSRRARGARPTRRGSARGCGSRPAGSTSREAAVADLQRVERPARIRHLGADRRRRRRGARGPSARCGRGPGGRGRAGRARGRRRRSRRALADARAARLPALLPDDGRRAAGGGGRHRRGAAALRGVARSSPPRPACASTTPRRCGAWPTSRPTATPSVAQLRTAARPRPRRRRRAPSSCGSRSTSTTCSARQARPLLERAIGAFDARDATASSRRRALAC